MPANFTRGNWECHYMPEEFRIKSKGCIITGDDRYIASVPNDSDARLIAAAPAMYKLLCALYQENAIPKTLGSLNYPALEKMHSIIEQVTNESSGVSP